MKERKLLEKFYEKTLTVDTEKSAARAQAAVRAAEVSAPQPRRGLIPARRLIAALSVCVLLIAAIPVLLVTFLKKDGGGSLPPVIPPPVEVLPVNPPQKYYYENRDVEWTDITIDTLAELYNGNLDLYGFNLTTITLFYPQEKPDINLFIRLTYNREQKEEFPAKLSNPDNVIIRIILADNAEFDWEEISFNDATLDQKLHFSVSGAALDVLYHENWDDVSFIAQVAGKFILNGQRYYVNAGYTKIPGVTTENLLEDIVKELLGLA